MPGDSALTLAIFKKSGSVIGQYIYKIGASQANYTLFSQTFLPALPQTPDTVVFACAAGNLMVNHGIPGTMLQIDSVSFTGVSSQPALFNGNFETWRNDTLYTLPGWNSNGTPLETNDKYSGSHAVELITNPPGFGNSQPQSSSILTSHNNNGPPRGGTPYSTQIDTFVFHYKYIPANYPTYTDSARVFVTFFKNGIQMMTNIWTLLAPSVSGYTKVELPFDVGSAPDTVLISFESSKYPMQDSYVGSDLKVDEIYFKSQELTVPNFIMPATGCKGVPIQLVDNSTNLASQWNWFMTGATPSTSNSQNPTITFNSSTTPKTYTVTLYASGPFGSIAPGYIQKTITIYDLPIISTSSATICSGSTATLTASGANTYTWNSQATGSTYTMAPSASSTVSVIGTSSVGCSNSAIANIVVSQAPTPDICMVTVDSLSINNIVYWDKTVYNNVDSFVVYRQVNSNVYNRIGAQPYSALSQFIDTVRSVGGTNNGDPNGGSYRYKLQTVDTCGNYSALGPYHNTVYIQHNSSGVFTWATSYSIENQTSPVTNYVLFCDTANTNVWTQIQSVAGNQQQVADAGYNNHSNIANWRVDATGFSCNPTLRLANGANSTMTVRVKSHSNQNNNRVAGIKQLAGTNQVTVYPNPATNVLNIGFVSATNKASVKITSLLGSEVYNNTQLSGSNLSIDISNLASGTYLVHITTDNVSEIKKIVKQ